ncbi:MAG: type III-A CRISPR-associated protein Csm2 [Candidatus Thioglobus sp.]|nr:type III-A CRISPR-associated protein Csm2 [Candidatus Thioglobus sp.]
MNGNYQKKSGGGKHHYENRGKPETGIPKEKVTVFIQDEDSTASMIQACEKFGRDLKYNKVSTSQLRNAYGSMKKLEMTGWNPTTQRQLLLIKPRLAYAAGRHGGGMKDLSSVVGYGIDAVGDSEGNFKRFCQFFEAIVAYFKAAGGS